MIRRLLSSISLALILGLSAPAYAESFEKTCTFFKNTAFRDSHTQGKITFRMTLAHHCHDALEIYFSSSPGTPQFERAEAYLIRLQHYNTTLRDMVVARFQRTVGADDDPVFDMMGRVVARPISEAGAYLIAQRMGLIAIQRDWDEWRSARKE